MRPPKTLDQPPTQQYLPKTQMSIPLGSTQPGLVGGWSSFFGGRSHVSSA